MSDLADYQGRQIRLTNERWAHISEHPEMARMRTALEEALCEPEVVVQSLSDPSVQLFYRFYERTLVGPKHLVVVVKFSGDDAFVVTAYLTDRIKKGDVVWPKER